MISQESNNFIPRPVPKPTQLEPVVASKPEVPEVSLVFDSTSSCKFRNPALHVSSNPGNLTTDNGPYQPNQFNDIDYNRITASQFYGSADNITPTITNNLPHQTNQFNRINSHPRSVRPSHCINTVKSTSDNGSHQPNRFNGMNDSLRSAAYPSSLKKPTESPNMTRKVSFSQESSLNSPSEIPVSNVENNTYEMRDNFSYCNTDLDRYLFLEEFSKPADMHDMQYFRRNGFSKNEICSRNKCACPGSFNFQTNYVTLEDVQKMTLKFENMLLKVNYKFSKMSENFVSRDELNSMVQKYDDQIEILTKRITELNAKLQSWMCKSPVAAVSSARLEVTKGDTYQIPSTVANLNSDSSNSLEDNSNNRGSPRVFSNVYEKRIHQEHQNDSNCNQDRRDYSVSTRLCSNPSSPRSVDQNMSRKEHSDAAEKTNANKLVTSECAIPNERRICENQGIDNKESTNKNYRVSNNHDENQHLRMMYENIVKDVEHIMKKNPSGNYEVDPLNVIRKVTIDQFRKLGINVDEIDEPEKCLNNSDSTTEHRIPESNAVASSDLSLHMNALAMKYIHDNIPCEKEQVERRPNGNDISIRSHCNNVSIATLQYMERYRLLSTEKFSDVAGQDKFEHFQNPQTRFYDKIANNDQSFIW